jgi:hypothetical protein
MVLYLKAGLITSQWGEQYKDITSINVGGQAAK